jgi:hypothetical protein
LGIGRSWGSPPLSLPLDCAAVQTLKRLANLHRQPVHLLRGITCGLVMNTISLKKVLYS